MEMNLPNNRPRKTLGYKTPNQVFFNSDIALQILIRLAKRSYNK